MRSSLQDSIPTFVRNVDTSRDQFSLLHTKSFVGGDWSPSRSENRISVIDPACDKTVGEIDCLTGNESRQAVDIADQAFKSWSSQLPQDRSLILTRWHDLILENREELARLITLEQGKPISEARGEIDYAASFIDFYSAEAKRVNLEGISSHLPDAQMLLSRQPLGVVGLITPWNFPCAMLVRKAAAALAAGCTVLAHPSAQTPFSALALAELACRAGFPKGVFNVLVGDAETIVGPWMQDSRVRAVSFTGSTKIGKLLYQQSASTMKRLMLELGGHAPFIVFADCDKSRVIGEAVNAKFATSGQDCLAANRYFVERSYYQEFCQSFADHIKNLSIGPGMDDPDIGPLISETAIKKLEQQIKDAVSKGAKLLVGGERQKADSLFFQPTLLVDVPDNADIMSEETFGPVAAVAAFDTDEEVIRRANDTEYGLVAYLHTKDFHRIRRLPEQLQFGMVAVNRTKITGAPVPFGGIKQSGLAREGSRHGLEAFTEIKYICQS